MALMDRWSARGRRRYIAAFALIMVAPNAAAAIPQAQAGARAPTARPQRCLDCEQESARREALFLRLDSLRWEIEHRRLTESERQHAATELARTLKALEVWLASPDRETRALMAIEADAAARQRDAHRAVAVQSVKVRRARGYIGVTFDGLWSRPPGSTEDNVIRFYEYPRIALVEASSPAERAGVLVGDTLIALNGDDVKAQEIAFGKLLTPNKRVTMRVRRDGAPRDVIVTVAEAPDFHVRRLTPSPTVAPRAAVPPGAPRAQGSVRVFSEQPALRGGRSAVGVYWTGEALAGARLETVTGGLARALDVAEGVLVIRTVPGTPTYVSGLREGDVVTYVGNTKVRTVTDLQRALTSGEGRERRLVIVREKKQRQVTLRW